MKKITLLGFMFYVCNIFAQGPYAPPYSTDFNTEGEITADWTYDNPVDKGLWIYSPDYFGIDESGSMVFIPTPATPSDNWAFSPSLALTAGVSYKLTFKYWNVYAGETANIAVAIGATNTAAAMTTVLVNIAEYDVPNYATSETVFTVPTTGNYTIGLHDFSTYGPNKGQSIEDFSVVENTASFIADAKSETVNVYPNPAKEVIAIQLASEKASKVQIYNITGVLVKEVELNGSNTIDVSGLSNGVYAVKVFTQDKVLCSKLNIQK
jgi:hypothetical protein